MMKRKLGWARWIGKACLVSGFVLSIYALAEFDRVLVNVSLGLLAAGILFMLLNFFFSLKSRGPDRGPSEQTTRGPDQRSRK